MRAFLFLLIFCSFSLEALSPSKESPPENYIIPCSHGVEMMELVLEAIQGAEQSVEVSLCITGGNIFHKILKALENRMIQVPELQVYVLAATTLLTDYELNLMEGLRCKFKEQFHYEYTLPVFVPLPELMTVDNHMKGVIVDEKYFSTGGSNFDDALISVGTFTPELPVLPSKESFLREQMPLGNRDQDVVGWGPIAKELRIYFHKQFALWEHYRKNPEHFLQDPDLFFNNNEYHSHYTPCDLQKKRAFIAALETSPKKCATRSVSLVVSGPQHKQNPIVTEYERLLKNAEKQVTIGNLYFNPSSEIFTALQKAAARGVACTVITNGLYENSPSFCPFVAWANRINYLPLMYGKEYSFWEKARAAQDPVFEKIHFYEYHVAQIMYHKKTMLIDNRYAVIGSFNLGDRSHSCDYEVILVIDSEEVAAHFMKIYAEDKSFCEKVTLAQVRDWYFNPVIRYLAALQKQFHAFF